jgi:hypothetical protein
VDDGIVVGVSDGDMDHIDFISNYCDRWCERCAFTSRCGAFAVQVAEGMCGDLNDAIELALGLPHPESQAEALRPSDAWGEEMEADEEPGAAHEAAMALEVRLEKAKASPIAQLASACSILASRWLESRAAAAAAPADPILTEALEIASWDAHLVGAKLARALSGRIADQAGERSEDDPIQNDWNGSAKVALISIERSEHAWRTIAQVTGEETPAALADQFVDLRQQVEAEFPEAWQFVRPGFDG